MNGILLEVMKLSVSIVASDKTSQALKERTELVLNQLFILAGNEIELVSRQQKEMLKQTSQILT